MIGSYLTMPPPEKKCFVFTKTFKTDFTVYLKRVFFVVLGWFYSLNIDFKKNKTLKLDGNIESSTLTSSVWRWPDLLIFYHMKIYSVVYFAIVSFLEKKKSGSISLNLKWLYSFTPVIYSWESIPKKGYY